MLIDVKEVKIVVCCKDYNTSKVREAACNAGAGIIGNYSMCTIRTKCESTFKGNENSNPTFGEPNKLVFSSEEKLEFKCELTKVKNVLKAIRNVHSYEEPGIDIIPLISEEDL